MKIFLFCTEYRVTQYNVFAGEYGLFRYGFKVMSRNFYIILLCEIHSAVDIYQIVGFF